MSKAVRVQQGLTVRLMQKISKLKRNRSELQRYFGATDFNFSRNQWIEPSLTAIPDIAFSTIPAMGLLPTMDIPLIEPFAESARKSTHKRSELIVSGSLGKLSANQQSQDRLIGCDTESKLEERVTVGKLLQTLDLAGARVTEVRALPNNGNCIRIKDLFEDNNEREYEYVVAGR